MTDAEKVAKYRATARDKTLPQEVRDQADMKANALEAKSVEKATGMKLAKGGAVKKMMYGGVAAKGLPMRGERTATNMAKGGAASKKPMKAMKKGK